MQSGLRIGQVASKSDVSVETVRFYEREGLLPAPRREPSGYRRFPPETPDVIRFVQRAKRLGFTLRETRELLDLRRQEQPGQPVRSHARAKLTEVEEKIRDLQRMRRSLRELLGECEAAGRSGACPILDALASGSAQVRLETERPKMADQRMVEVFSAGCPTCREAVERVRAMACPSCEVVVRDMHDPQVSQRAKELGVQSVPAVVVDGKLAMCCAERGLDDSALRAAGVGQPRD